MKKNDCGVYVNCEKIEFPVKIPKGWDNYREGITVKYGESEGKWGFGTDFQTATYGQGCGISDDDLIYNSKNEVIEAIREEVINLCNKHFNGKLMFNGEHLDFILDKLIDKQEICCNFENEDSWTLVSIKDPAKIFDQIEDLYKKPAKSFELDGKKFFNPNYKKTNKYEQMELF